MPLLFKKRIPFPTLAFVTATALCAALPGQLMAQREAFESLDSSTVTYPAAYFAEFSPVSVNDMLNVIPGIGQAMGRGRSGGGGNRRGLGAGENEILINGQRVTGKSNSSYDQLSRIPASQVQYIEIIRGSSQTLDIRNAGQTLNIVLLSEQSRRSINTEVNVDHLADGTLDPGGKIAFSGQTGSFNYLLSAEAEPNYNYNERRENSFNPDYSLNEIILEEERRDQTSYQISSAVSYQFERDVLQFNAQYGERSPRIDSERLKTGYTRNPVTESRERERREFDSNNWEVGGDWEHPFDNGNKYRLLFIVNDAKGAGGRERFAVNGTDETKNLYLYNSNRDRERIVRTSYTLNLGQLHGLEIGIERAQTIYNSGLRMGLPGTGVKSAAVGGLVPVIIPNANGQVEEMRYETFAVHNWKFNDRMSLETTFLFENSEISQSGDVSNSRGFDFFRPKIDYRFDITSMLQFRAGIEKEVNQLSFSDFTSSTDNSDDDKNTQAGNPGIAQEQAWVYSLNLEYRLPNNAGVVSGGVYYRDIQDHIDRIDLSTPTILESAKGNIGDAERYGINLNFSSKLDILGLSNAQLTANLGLSDSKVTDPFLGTERRVRGNGRGFVGLGFRHDLPAMNMNYGFNYSNPIAGGTGRMFIDIDDIEVEKNSPNLTLFFEKKAFGGTTFRFEAMNTLNGEYCRERTRFIGATVDAIVEEIEDSCNSSGRKFALKVRRTF